MDLFEHYVTPNSKFQTQRNGKSRSHAGRYPEIQGHPDNHLVKQVFLNTQKLVSVPPGAKVVWRCLKCGSAGRHKQTCDRSGVDMQEKMFYEFKAKVLTKRHKARHNNSKDNNAGDVHPPHSLTPTDDRAALLAAAVDGVSSTLEQQKKQHVNPVRTPSPFSSAANAFPAQLTPIPPQNSTSGNTGDPPPSTHHTVSSTLLSDSMSLPTSRWHHGEQFFKQVGKFPQCSNNELSFKYTLARKAEYVAFRERWPSIKKFFPDFLLTNKPNENDKLYDGAALVVIDVGLFYGHIFDMCDTVCVHCNGSGFKRVGFCKGFHVVRKSNGECDLLKVVQYRHHNCPMASSVINSNGKRVRKKSTMFSGLHPRMVSQYPASIQAKLGNVLSGRSISDDLDAEKVCARAAPLVEQHLNDENDSLPDDK